MIWQYFENVYQFDYKIPVTIWHLFRRPGFLTNEFNAGKIASYMHPMKLNMFVLVVFFTIVIFMGEKIMDKEFTQANIPEYIKQNLEVDPDYFAGKDTLLFFIGNPHLLGEYPSVFTVEKLFSSGKHSRKKLSDEDTGGMAAEVSEKNPQWANKFAEDFRKGYAHYSYDDEQSGCDTLLVKVPSVFLRDGIFVNAQVSVPDSYFAKAGLEKGYFAKELSDLQKLVVGQVEEALRNNKVNGELDSAEMAQLKDELAAVSAVFFHKVTAKKKFAKIDNSNVVKKNYVDELMSLSKTWLPLVFLLTMPFLAFTLKVVYRKKRMNYMSHFVFSLHFSSVMFIMLFILLLLWGYAAFIPKEVLFKAYLALLFIYFIIASHTVYTGTDWIKSILKSLFVLFLYLLGTLIVLTALFLIFIMDKAGV